MNTFLPAGPHVAALALLSVLGLARPAQAQQDVWSDEELDKQMEGFKSAETLASLQTLSHLLKHQEKAFPAICNRIHGNHAEYLLRIEKLLDELTNERWEVREKAEKTLIEVGGKARELIMSRSKSADTVEERIRAARALTAIDLAGNQKEEIEKRYLRGLAHTALYMDSKPKLVKALVSALQHTDPLIVDHCIRALGRHGGDAEAKRLIELLKSESATHGHTILATLAVMKGTVGRDHIVGRILSGKLNETHALLLLRTLREREDGEETMARLAGAKDAVVAGAAKIALGTAEGAPLMVRVSLADQTVVEGHFLGYVSDSLRMAKPTIVKGKDRTTIEVPELSFPLNRCDGIKVLGAKPNKNISKCRVFLVQGTLVTGDLLGVTREKVLVDSATFGKMEVQRSLVQGLAVDPKLDRLLGASNKHDKVRLKNNKFMVGTILQLDDKGLAFQDEKGKAHTVAMDQISGLLFKRPLTTTVDTRTFTRVTLANGDKVLGHVAAIEASQLGMTAPGVGTTTVPTKQVVEMEFGMGGGAMWGFTLVADYSDNRIVEFDDQGREVFTIEEIFGVWDVECLDNGNLLITEFSVNRVSEVTRENKTVWQFEDLKNPYDADRLPNGNTLIADTFGRRVIEVNKAGKIVWSYDKDIHPYDVDRLPNGNTLIADTHDDRVIEVNKEGKIVWQIKNVPNVHDADRLPNGNTLLTIRMLNEVREVNPAGKTVFTLKDLSSPSDADRLPNGNTIVAENGFVREFDRHGHKVWEKPITWAVEVNRY